ncbi:MAG: epoxyqueuosine reductase QueH [Bacteriovoracales bacterium]|nr:epoxyqueuosine reductase QueH [Bacteriovoracales bacterium]
MGTFPYKNARRNKIVPPNGEKKLLLHSCCAPCAGEMMEAMVESGIHLTVFFYNPNIHPVREYEIRKNENIRYCQKLGIPFVDADYDVDRWFARAKGLEWEPERGARCTLCFDMRFERTALYAHEHAFSLWATSLGISRWKNMEQINASGHRAGRAYPNVSYWDFNWRKGGGSARMYEIAKREQFYQQEYCGCVYSLRDTNRWRAQSGRQRIAIGKNFYDETPPRPSPQKPQMELPNGPKGC